MTKCQLLSQAHPNPCGMHLVKIEAFAILVRVQGGPGRVKPLPHCSACQQGKHWLMARETDLEQDISCSVFYFASIWINDLKQITALLALFALIHCRVVIIPLRIVAKPNNALCSP